jgi:hypothetical protein
MPHLSRRFHYFIDGTAVCGKWAYLNRDVAAYTADNGQPGKDDCAACARVRQEQRDAAAALERGELPHVTRPRVVIEPDATGTMYVARCEHCPWTKGPTAKSWLEEQEVRPHRAAHRNAPKAGAR